MDKSVFAPVASMSEKVGIYYKNLTNGDTFIQNGDMPLLAASVIKLPILAFIMQLEYSGRLDRNEKLTVREEDKLPSCGALNVMHAGLEVTVQDLYNLMITLSDNTATNLLIKRLGIDEINSAMQGFGMRSSRLNRLLFDSEAGKRGLENYVSASDVALLLEGIYRGTLVCSEASEEMLYILRQQKLKGKLPLSLPRGTAVAHKTGEDSGVTHDVGIVFARNPYIICLMANEVDAPSFEMALHGVSRALFDINNA